MSAPVLLSADEETELFEMANLFPATTGLPMTIWVSPRGHARHDARVKVCRTHGATMDIADTAVVAIRPAPRLIAGELDRDDLQAVRIWIALNAASLIEYWDGRIDTIQLAGQLRRLPVD
ncbi:MAG: hypothetical protein ABI369_07565 [Acetobacteraceae bacterium]